MRETKKTCDREVINHRDQPISQNHNSSCKGMPAIGNGHKRALHILCKTSPFFPIVTLGCNSPRKNFLDFSRMRWFGWFTMRRVNFYGKYCTGNNRRVQSHAMPYYALYLTFESTAFSIIKNISTLQ